MNSATHKLNQAVCFCQFDWRQIITLLLTRCSNSICHVCLPSSWYTDFKLANQPIKVVRKIDIWCSIGHAPFHPTAGYWPLLPPFCTYKLTKLGQQTAAIRSLFQLHSTILALYYKNKYYSLIVSVEDTYIYRVNDHKLSCMYKIWFFSAVIFKSHILADLYILLNRG